LVVFYPSFYVVLKNWNRKCFWTSVYILQNGLYSYMCVCVCIHRISTIYSYNVFWNVL